MVVFDPAHDAVSLVLRLAGGHVQFVHLNGLQLERDQSLFGVAVKEQQAAVHLFAVYRHTQHLVETLFAGHVAVSGLAPLAPCLFQFFVQFVVAGFRLEGVALAHHVALVGVEDRLGNIAVALQIAGAGAYHVTAETIRNFRAFVVNPPPGI